MPSDGLLPLSPSEPERAPSDLFCGAALADATHGLSAVLFFRSEDVWRCEREKPVQPRNGGRRRSRTSDDAAEIADGVLFDVVRVFARKERTTLAGAPLDFVTPGAIALILIDAPRQAMVVKRQSCCGLPTGEPTEEETMWGFRKVGNRVFDNIILRSQERGWLINVPESPVLRS